MEQTNRPPVHWNRIEVSDHLLPFLRLGDAMRADDTTEEQLAALKRLAWTSLSADPTAYRQLSHVYQRADDETYQRWFGGIDCDDALLQAAFSLIDRALHYLSPSVAVQNPADASPNDTPTAASYQEPLRREESRTEDAAFRKLFRVSHTYTDEQSGRVRVRRIDLLVPFIELCRTTDAAPRQKAEQHCRHAVRSHLSDYMHALSYYREHYASGPAATALLPETHTCMECLEHMIARCDYETRLSEQKASLEYERGGLGWFGKTRKREIDRELRDLSITELQMEIEDEKARLQGALDPLQARLEALETELAAAPLTAFARKKALKAAIAELNEEIRTTQSKTNLAALNAQLRTLQAKQNKKR
jgi:hypothetical protein